MQSHQALLDDYHFTRMIEVSVVENFGRIVVLWDDNILKLDDITTTNQEIHAMVKVHLTKVSWLFSVIYTSNFRLHRHTLWDNLRAIKDNYTGMWLVGGDFNEIMNSSEKKRWQTYEWC